MGEANKRTTSAERRGDETWDWYSKTQPQICALETIRDGLYCGVNIRRTNQPWCAYQIPFADIVVRNAPSEWNTTRITWVLPVPLFLFLSLPLPLSLASHSSKAWTLYGIMKYRRRRSVAQAGSWKRAHLPFSHHNEEGHWDVRQAACLTDPAFKYELYHCAGY